MARTLRFPNSKFPANPSPRQRMTLGDVLYRLALVAPDRYEGFETMARAIYAEVWPTQDIDPLVLLEEEGKKLLS